MTPWVVAALAFGAVSVLQGKGMFGPTVLADWPSVGEWIILISAITSALTAVIGAIFAGIIQVKKVLQAQNEKLNEKLDSQNEKIDAVAKATNGNLTKAIETAADKVKEATLANPLEQTEFPTTREQLVKLMEEVSRKAASDALASHAASQT